MRRLFFILLIINFVLIILIPLLIDLIGKGDAWAGYYASYAIVPVFFISLLILLGMVIYGFIADMRKSGESARDDDQSE